MISYSNNFPLIKNYYLFSMKYSTYSLSYY